MSMTSAMGNRHSQHSFSQVPSANTPRSVFNRSFTAKDTMDFDFLTPFFVEEILPGDTVNLNVKTFARLAPQIKPLMDRMQIDYYFFFCPYRLLWSNFQKQMGEQENPGDSIDFLTPILAPTNTTFTVGSIYDKLGYPTGINLANAGANMPTAYEARMYNLTFNHWFRDQSLQNSLIVPKDDGPDPLSNYVLVKNAKKHDYFTSALPFLQKGNPVNIPITGTAPVFGNGAPVALTLNPVDPSTNRFARFTNDNNASSNVNTLGFTGPSVIPDASVYFPTTLSASAGETPGLQVNFNEQNNVLMTINSFREAMQLQSFLERDARGGTRYVEILKSHFNVNSPDARLQRVEFLSGATIDIGQHVVAQTSESGETPQGNLSAFSTASEFGNKIGFQKSFVEHGVVMGLCRARGEVTYQQGMPRRLNRRTRYQYFWPEFQELGEQTIQRKEIFFSGIYNDDNATWAYQERHAEYRYRPSEIRGQFRSTFAESLDVWHLAEEFASAPALNSAFIQGNTPIERNLTVPDPNYPHLLVDYFFDFKHVRPMVAYPVPASLGRF